MLELMWVQRDRIVKIIKIGPDQTVRSGTRPASDPSQPQNWSAHELVFERKTGKNWKTSGSGLVPVKKNYLIFLIQKINK
jgi:hypothetical protein